MKGEGYKRVWGCQTRKQSKSQCTANFSIPEHELEQAFTTVIRELLEDETVLKDLMINMAEALDTTKVSERLEKYDGELNQQRKRLYELMQVQVGSLHARKQIDEEIHGIMRASEGIQTERDKLIASVERSDLDAKRLEEMKEFIKANNPLQEFDTALFKKLIRQAIVHSRNEIEFIFCMGLSRRVALGTPIEEKTA